MPADLFNATDAKTLAEALYVRGVVRTGAATPDALHELQERCVKASLALAETWNADRPALCPSCFEVKNVTDPERRIFRQQDRLEDKAARDLLELLDAARKRLAGELRDLPTGSRSTALLQTLLGAATDALNRARVELTSSLGGAVTDAMALGVDLAETVLGEAEAVIPFRFNDETLRQIAGYHADLVTGLTDSVRAAVTREVQLGILAGTDGREIVKRITAAGVNATGPFPTAENRADTIARTEINRVGNMATWDRYEDAATRIATLEKSWISAGDNRVRPSHRALNNKTIPMSEMFDVGGTQAPYPMWPGLPASESIACRCRLRVKQTEDAE